jgi:hypothetical protein
VAIDGRGGSLKILHFLALAVDQDTLPVRVVDTVAVAGWQWWQSKEEIRAVILVPDWRYGCGY